MFFADSTILWKTVQLTGVSFLNIAHRNIPQFVKYFKILLYIINLV